MSDGENVRLRRLLGVLSRRRVDAAVLCGEFNVRSLVGVGSDNACLLMVSDREPVLFTDFRYIPMVHRLAPSLKCVEQRRGESFPFLVREALRRWGIKPHRLGYEGSISARSFQSLSKAFPRAALVDVEPDVRNVRAVKTRAEIEGIAAAAALNDEVWARARREMRSGMTEKEIQRVIRAWMNALGDGEAFETIVCAGPNAAECHHVPDSTVWRRGMPLLVDMGVKLDGWCSDLTRCIPSSDPEYKRIYGIVLEANRAGIAAVRPGMTTGELDAVARRVIRRAGYGKAFGHSLGHGVGLEVHEAPTARAKDRTVLRPGMVLTVEPGIYLEGRLGVRIEDLVLVTPEGCECLSRSRK